MALLEIREVTKRFGGLIALSGFKLEVQQGEILGLIGPNGSGKTTTFNVITGFLKPDGGKVIFEGEDITGLQPYAIAKKGVIRTFQLANLFFDLTVLDNVLIGFHNLSKITMLDELLNTRSRRKEKKELLGRAMEILQLTELDSHKEKLAKNLSAGWRKTLAIAVALAANPKLLLLDEPVCTLSPARVASIINLIMKVRDSGVTVMLIEHNMRAIMDYCDRIAVLNFGKKIADGSPERVKRNREVIDAYLGM
jgi:branched-chain amino acid transport system ATP-binding protein